MAISPRRHFYHRAHTLRRTRADLIEAAHGAGGHR